MSYFTPKAVLDALKIDWDDSPIPEDMPRGCELPTYEYGDEEGVSTFDEGVGSGLLQKIDRVEWPERIEALERGESTLQDRIDADWQRALTQGRCGYCWSYAVICAMQANDARDGLPHRPLSAASVAAQIKRGKNQGGWPVAAAKWIYRNGVCLREEWGDCSCKGGSCRGPSSGCQARDLSLTEKTSRSAEMHKIGKFFELPRNDFDSCVSCILQGIPVALGWVGTGAWCDGHAMGCLHVVRDGRRGYALVPDNSWGNYKRRNPVTRAPSGGVAILNNQVIRPHEPSFATAV